jgi:hypothetical protein
MRSVGPKHKKRKLNRDGNIIVILVLALLGALPNWGHSRNWGYGPSGLLGTILIIVLIIYLLQRI